MDALDKKGRAYLADPVLDPINFGFMESLERYARVRRDRPNAEMLMGTGNLTELTDADTTGITAMLLGIASELHIRNVLVVQVSPHTRRTVEEHDLARRMMFAARAEQSLPKDYTDAAAGAACAPARSRRRRRRSPRAPREVRDKNFRIEIAEDGIHIYQPRRPSRRAGRVRALSASSASTRTARTRFISGWSWRAPRSPGGSASAMPRTSRSTGALPPMRRPTTGPGCKKPATR